jgi:hypothetical protein
MQTHHDIDGLLGHKRVLLIARYQIYQEICHEYLPKSVPAIGTVFDLH